MRRARLRNKWPRRSNPLLIWITSSGRETSHSRKGFLKEPTTPVQLPAFVTYSFVQVDHVLTFRSSIPSFPAEYKFCLDERFLWGTPAPFIDPVPVKVDSRESGKNSWRERSTLQEFIFITCLTIDAPDFAPILTINLAAVIRREADMWDEVVVRRSGFPCRIEFDVWFKIARRCVVDLW